MEERPQWKRDTDTVYSQTSKGRVVSPRFSLPSHSQKMEAAPTPPPVQRQSRSDKLSHPETQFKNLIFTSTRPVTAITNAVLDPSRLLDTGKGEGVLLTHPKFAIHQQQTQQLNVSETSGRMQQVQAVPVPLKPPTPPVQTVPETGKQESQPAAKAASPAKKRRKLWQRRLSEKRQTIATECGAACLAMILEYHGRATRISEVQERCGVGRDGLSARTVVKAARQYGLRVRAVAVKKDDLRYVSLPAIIHWEFNHFVILERWSTKHVDIVDPAQGRRRITSEEFNDGFTGVTIMLEPGPQFERREAQHSLSLWSYVRSLLRMRTIIMQILMASIFLQLLGLGMPLLTTVVIDTIIPSGAFGLLKMLGLGMLLLLLAQGVTKLLRASLLIYLQTRIDVRMMLDFFEHLLSLPYRYFQLRLNGDLLSRVSSNTAIRELLTGQLISAVLDSTTVVIYCAILFWLSPMIACITLVIGAFQVALLLLTAPTVRRLTERDLVVQGKAQGYLNEVLAGIATIKAAGAENKAFDHWTDLYFEQMNVSTRRNYLLAVINIVFEFLFIMAPMVLLWVGAMQVIAGNMSLGTMLALNTLAVAFLAPLSSLTASGQKLQIAQAHFERIADVLDSAPEQNPQQVRTPPRLSGHIEVQGVNFQYAPNTAMILQDIQVTIRPGQKVALVGKTGSGKSTLGKLLIGLITPTSGHIFYDGMPLEHLNYQEVRRQFGVVLQEAFIFSGSVRENIAFHHPEMSLDEVKGAARAAAIDDDIEKMPMGYETLVAEGGSAFSGGQRQRLALARALAHQPAILLLDEATSALDVATEHVVEQNIDSFSCTQLIIAHRLSTIRNADLILVVDQGRIVEQGRHELLVRRKGYYARLIETQIGNGEIEVA